MNRRSFLKNSIAGAAVLSAPSIQGMSGALSVNDRLNVAYVGLGGIGRFAAVGNHREHTCGYCDVDDAYASKVYKEKPFVPRFRDYRKLFDSLGDGIDVVSIATPDHSHFPIAMEAMQRGYHVYLEKPMAHTISQIRMLRKAAQKYGVKTQLGIQGRSFAGTRVLKEWLESGVIGEVIDIHFWTNRPSGRDYHTFELDAPGQAVPDTLDWNLFLGPARERPYNEIYTPKKWRGWWNFGNGPLGDIGAHMWDVAEYCLEIGLPKVVSARRSRVSDVGTPRWIEADYSFESKVQSLPIALHWYSGRRNGKPNLPNKLPYWDDEVEINEDSGMYFVGQRGGIYVPYMRVETQPYVFPKSLWSDFKQNLPAKRLLRVKGNHYSEFFQAIRDGRKANADFEYSAILSESVLVGNLAVRTGKTIHWDAENAKAVGVPEADLYVNGPAPRKGWEYSL